MNAWNYIAVWIFVLIANIIHLKISSPTSTNFNFFIAMSLSKKIIKQPQNLIQI